jgi:predicted regulator of Ras-like GTPase activity (Roadblock/LC7/MglB family)
MAAILESLKDVSGVAGSFAMDNDGELVAMAMPSYVQTEDLATVAPRIGWLVEAASELQVQCEWCVLYFSGYHLQIAPFRGGRLVVLTAPDVNARALRMAAKILCRKLEKLVEGAASHRDSISPPAGLPGVSTLAGAHPRLAGSHQFAPPTPRTTPRFEGVSTFEVSARGRMPERSSEPPEAARATELRNTQPSLVPPSIEPDPPTPRQGAESVSPEARSSRRVAGPRSLVYRGRRYDVSG